jgi:chemotaxis protein methyltransferase WspC
MNASGVETVIRERLGLDTAALGPSVLPRTIENRMKAKEETVLESYLRSLTTDPHEIEALAEELVVSESWFFRGGLPLYQALAEFVADRTGSRPVGSPVRLLSLPCSTGEEPLSLAISIHKLGVPTTMYEIDAVDLSSAHVEAAKAGVYSAFAFREPGVDIRPTYFTKINASWIPLPKIRQVVNYRTGNIVDPLFMRNALPYDLILCRNLFIYLTPDGRKKAIAALDRLLAPNGSLCVTAAEADRLPAGHFASVGPIEFGFYRRIETVNSFNSANKLKTVIAPPSTAIANPVPRQQHTTFSSASAMTSDRDRNELREKKSLKTSDVVNPNSNTLERARDLADAGRLSEARDACEEIIRTQSDLPDAYSLLGVIHQAEGRVSEAAKAFRKALYLSPDHLESLTHMIVLCNARGDTAQAAVLQKRAMRLAAGDSA